MAFNLCKEKNREKNASTLYDEADHAQYIHASTEPVYLECPEGIALLAVSVDGMSFEEFVMAPSSTVTSISP